jgi:hypothetical protein
MKKLILISLLFIISPIIFAQKVTSWIQQSDYEAYMWPSFVAFKNGTPTIGFSNYQIVVTNNNPGRINLSACKTTPAEALAAAKMIIGSNHEIFRYRISKSNPNIIPYHNGAILYGYWKEKKHWEIFNIQAGSIVQHKPYQLLTVESK